MTLSYHDASILAVLQTFPSMSASEADHHLSRIDDRDAKEIGRVLLGRIERECLEPSLQICLDEWLSAQHEQHNTITPHARNLIERHQRGEVSDETLYIFGISGALPELGGYHTMSDKEKYDFWSRRVTKRLGENWREMLPSLCAIFDAAFGEKVDGNENWQEDGF